MPVRVKVPTIFRSFVGGQAVVEGDGGTVRALLDDLDHRFPGIKGTILTEDGALHRFVNLYVNDEDVRFTGSLDTSINEGDTISILPAVAGGSS
jgi:molybdopterin synthase sulfur carrier subunit